MSYHHFSTFECERIQKCFKLGYSNRAIARKLRRHHFSNDREVRRNIFGNSYIGETSQTFYKLVVLSPNLKGNALTI